MTPNPTCWFLTGSQGLYGPETLAQVEQQSQAIVDQLNDAGTLPVPVQWQPVLTESGAIHKIIMAANADHGRTHFKWAKDGTATASA